MSSLKFIIAAGLITLSIQSHACLFNKSNYEINLKGQMTIVEYDLIYDSCKVIDGTISLEKGQLFKVNRLTADCSKLLVEYNSLFLWLKDGLVNQEYEGFDGKYDDKNISVHYSFLGSNVSPPYQETLNLSWSPDCKSLNISMQSTGRDGLSFTGQLDLIQ